jgi:hypothetical protein
MEIEFPFLSSTMKSSRLPRALANFSIIFNQLQRTEAIKSGILLNFPLHERTYLALSLPLNPQVLAATKIKLWSKSSRKNVLIFAIMKIA